MPGIFGVVSERPLPDAAGLGREMGALLSSHAGQRSAVACGARWLLGATWIPGQQLDPEPARSADGRTWAVTHGEVYPAGDAPTRPPVSPRPPVLEALAAGDPSRLARVNGQFAGAVVDAATGAMTLVCDRYGLHPLYWTQRNGTFAFASEVKALLALPGVGDEIDPQGLASFLLLGEVFSDWTVLSRVRIAPAASTVRSSGEAPRIDTWWRIRFLEAERARDPSEAAREAGRLFRRAVERQTAGEARLGVPLSGGLDSRICLAGVPEDRQAAVTSFTWGDPGCFDRRFAGQLARRMGVRHRDYDYRYEAVLDSAARGTWITDGLAGAADFHVLPYLDELASASDVILNGFAGDVVLGGNFHWRRFHDPKVTLEGIAAGAFRKRNDTLPVAEADAILHGPARDAARGLEAAFVRAFMSHRQEDRYGSLDAFMLDSRVRRWTSFGTQLLRTRLVSRAPFYDNDFFDFLLTVPPDWRTDHRLYRRVMLHAFPDAARVGWQSTGVPASWPPQVFRPIGLAARKGLGVLERLSRGAIRNPYPVARPGPAYRTVLAPRLQAALFEETGLHWELFDRRAGERVWQELQAGSDGRAKLVGVLLALRHFLAQCRGVERPAPPLAPGEVAVERSPADAAA